MSDHRHVSPAPAILAIADRLADEHPDWSGLRCLHEAERLMQQAAARRKPGRMRGLIARMTPGVPRRPW